ncbi:hypothetical protein SAMN05216353_10761 [Halobacillus alkaliphilus]|uniref:Uncharacterized protein n=1 Tax=Halobacillus alkaliphilus TaxID=396056 RepID=A0A1I2L896_9BACI|nr:hypothetical protein [Halobacillus alkaliphilus]SFF73316.1 hypothetical protein SAMN05216353_10761 [Halobacillus alkaliphilus]
MKKLCNMWTDELGILGILEWEDEVFGTCFRPIKISENEYGGFSLIGKRWYTTYNGAREFFRHKTNDLTINGRMKKKDLGTMNYVVKKRQRDTYNITEK